MAGSADPKPGVICLKGTSLTQLDKADIEWTARMLYGEAGGDCHLDGEGAAVLWTMINRYAMLFPLYKSFTQFIRAYSQPINPKFLNGGSKDKDPKHVDERELRREAIVKMTLQSFPAGLVQLVRNILCPVLMVTPNEELMGLVHFYSPCFYYAKHLGVRQRNLTPDQVGFACRTAFGGAKGLMWRQPPGINPQGNAFYRIAKRWRYDTVAVKAAGSL